LGAVPEPAADFPLFDAERLALILELRPPVVSFHFGLPDEAALRAIRASGAYVLSSATTVGEARHLEAAGINAIIAQGVEAGGHRATFMAPRDAGTIDTLGLSSRRW
jgi:nitronate monooxygenase